MSFTELRLRVVHRFYDLRAPEVRYDIFQLYGRYIIREGSVSQDLPPRDRRGSLCLPLEGVSVHTIHLQLLHYRVAYTHSKGWEKGASQQQKEGSPLVADPESPWQHPTPALGHLCLSHLRVTPILQLDSDWSLHPLQSQVVRAALIRIGKKHQLEDISKPRK